MAETFESARLTDEEKQKTIKDCDTDHEEPDFCLTHQRDVVSCWVDAIAEAATTKALRVFIEATEECFVWYKPRGRFPAHKRIHLDDWQVLKEALLEGG